MKNTLFFAVTCLAATVSQQAWAGPESLEEQELFDLADVVADVEVVSLACDGEPYSTQYFYETPYVAEMQIRAVHKGAPAETLTYRVTTSEAIGEEGEAGCSAPAYVLPDGWVGRVYLQEAGSLGYWIENPGGAVDDVAQSQPTQAPMCGVEAISPTSPEPEPPTPPFEGDPVSDPESDDDATTVSSCSVSVPGADPSAMAALVLAGIALGVSRRRRAQLAN